MTINVIKIYTISSATMCVLLMQNGYKATTEWNTICVMQTFAHIGHYTILMTSVKIFDWVTEQIFLIWSQFYYIIFCNVGSHKNATNARKQKWAHYGLAILESSDQVPCTGPKQVGTSPCFTSDKQVKSPKYCIAKNLTQQMTCKVSQV